MRIAIIGTGVSGLGAAYLLHSDHELTIYEKRDRIGGHAHTVDADYDGTPIPVDTGFIVYNDRNYPNLTRLFERLKVPTRVSDMSFGVSSRGGELEWSGGSLGAVFAQKRNLMRPAFLEMLRDIMRFNRQAIADLDAGALSNVTIGDYLYLRGFSESFARDYLEPMGAAIWSAPRSKIFDFPAASFIRFFNNHGLLSFDRHHWRTVEGGSREYVNRLVAPFRAAIRLGCGVTHVKREADRVLVTGANGETEAYDQVIFACHSDQVLPLLSCPTAEEVRVLGDLKYTPNQAYLHRDLSLMPRRRKVWSSWNYICGDYDDPDLPNATITYWMNRLQGIDMAYQLYVTLNPTEPPAPELTFSHFVYDHPQFDSGALTAQRALPGLQGKNRSWYCGAYSGFGFHEDGLRSGLDVAERLSGQVRPWARKPIAEEHHDLPGDGT